MSSEAVTVTRGPWSAVWTGGSRADIWHLESPTAVDSLNLWDHEAGDFAEPVTAELLTEALAVWVDEVGDDYARQVGY